VFDRIICVCVIGLLAAVIAPPGASIEIAARQSEQESNEEFNNALIEQVKIQRLNERNK
jgi:hypothetical protein